MGCRAMKNLIDLLPMVRSKIESPVLIALGAPWPITQVVEALAGLKVTCFQMDFFQAQRLREKLFFSHILHPEPHTPHPIETPPGIRGA